ncbi:CRISPR-associated protein Cas3 [Chitinispirillum alkaliphilum]|nr:CRISPR-associated protein Cas3 [Chitinispirillum alkaliphilum]
MVKNKFYKYWGKTRVSEDGDLFYHLLPYHCLDVAAVGRIWLDNNEKFVKNAAGAFGLSENAFTEWFLFFLSLHDLGKFSTRFQNLNKFLLKQLQGIETDESYEPRHDQLGWVLYNKHLLNLLYNELFPDCKETVFKVLINTFASCFFGHHGLPPENDMYSGVKLYSTSDKESAYEFSIAMSEKFLTNESINELRAIINLPKTERDAIKSNLKQESWSLAGLVTICDWIGSGDTFEFCSKEVDLTTYYNAALKTAEKAVRDAEIIGTRVSQFGGLEHLFPSFADSPTPLQRLCNETDISEGPQLWILEDVTGAGKTEAALTLVSRILAHGGGDGCFVALPTMATSNAMYERMAAVYRLLFNDDKKPSLVLSHGSRYLSETFRNSYRDTFIGLPEDTEENESAEHEGVAHCAQWLGDSSKKSLIADCGVGTIDQILLGGLPVRYQNLRAFGMRRKVLVVDEVHAYDPYMLRHLENILAFHAASGGSAVLLSATLPQNIRKRFVDSFTEGLGGEELTLTEKNFPLVTTVGKKTLLEARADTRKELKRSVKIEFQDNVEELENLITESALSGKCVCWIRNTVTDVIDSYTKLCATGKMDHDKLDLFHSRLALHDRLSVEKRILQHFGKESGATDRHGRVLIASQVVEQSLDLDFDILISDLAPIDFLIQRAGRLHRHLRDAQGNRIQPDVCTDRSDPVFFIHSPPATEKPKASWYKDQFPNGCYVYKDTAVLWRSFEALKTKGALRMPEEGRDLIEAVYGEWQIETPPVFDIAENGSWAEMMTKKSMADFNMLHFPSGYSRASNTKNQWDVEEKVQSRLSEPQNTMYLCRWVNGEIVPLYSNVEYPWELSSLKIRKSKLVKVDYSKAAEEYVANLQKQRRFKFDTLFVVFEDEQLKASGWDERGRKVEIVYDRDVGLSISC